MSAPRPLRLHLPPRAFERDLQALSRAANGLPWRRICGATMFRNPYDDQVLGDADPILRVQLFCDMLRDRGSSRAFYIRTHLYRLAGHNLFCTCAEGEPCHGDVLIPMANGRVV